MNHSRVTSILISLALLALPAVAVAQGGLGGGDPFHKRDPACKWICQPTFLWQGGTITQFAFTDDVETTTDFNLRFTVAASTILPRLGLAVLFQWQPTVDANFPAIVYGATVGLVTSENTKGWFVVHLDILGLFSTSAPSSEKAYTHKFLPELYVDVSPFNSLPKNNWLRNVSIFGILDYVATGLGDDATQPWPIVAGLQFPLMPLP